LNDAQLVLVVLQPIVDLADENHPLVGEKADSLVQLLLIIEIDSSWFAARIRS